LMNLHGPSRTICRSERSEESRSYKAEKELPGFFASLRMTDLARIRVSAEDSESTIDLLEQ